MRAETVIFRQFWPAKQTELKKHTLQSFNELLWVNMPLVLSITNGKCICFLTIISASAVDTDLPSFSQKSAGGTCPHLRSFRSRRRQWDSPWESAAEPVVVCSRWNSWTGWMGALKYCKPNTGLVVWGGDVSAAFLFCWKSPSFLSSLPGSASLSDGGWRRSSHHWGPPVLPREPKAKLRHFFILYFFSSAAWFVMAWLHR